MERFSHNRYDHTQRKGGHTASGSLLKFKFKERLLAGWTLQSERRTLPNTRSKCSSVEQSKSNLKIEIWNSEPCLTEQREVVALLTQRVSFHRVLLGSCLETQTQKDNLHRESFHASQLATHPSPKTVSAITLVWDPSQQQGTNKKFPSICPLKWHPWKRPSPSRPFE